VTVLRTSSGTAIAVQPCTTACSPLMIIFVGADAEIFMIYTCLPTDINLAGNYSIVVSGFG